MPILVPACHGVTLGAQMAAEWQDIDPSVFGETHAIIARMPGLECHLLPKHRGVFLIDRDLVHVVTRPGARGNWLTRAVVRWFNGLLLVRGDLFGPLELHKINDTRYAWYQRLSADFRDIGNRRFYRFTYPILQR